MHGYTLWQGVSWFHHNLNRPSVLTCARQQWLVPGDGSGWGECREGSVALQRLDQGALRWIAAQCNCWPKRGANCVRRLVVRASRLGRRGVEQTARRHRHQSLPPILEHSPLGVCATPLWEVACLQHHWMIRHHCVRCVAARVPSRWRARCSCGHQHVGHAPRAAASPLVEWSVGGSGHWQSDRVLATETVGGTAHVIPTHPPIVEGARHQPRELRPSHHVGAALQSLRCCHHRHCDELRCEHCPTPQNQRRCWKTGHHPQTRPHHRSLLQAPALPVPVDTAATPWHEARRSGLVRSPTVRSVAAVDAWHPARHRVRQHAVRLPYRPRPVLFAVRVAPFGQSALHARECVPCVSVSSAFCAAGCASTGCTHGGWRRVHQSMRAFLA